MPADVGRHRSERRRPMGRDEAIGVVLDDWNIVPPRNPADGGAPPLGDRDGRWVLQCRIEINRLWRVQAHALFQSLGDYAVAVHFDADQFDPELGGDRPYARIRHVLAQDHFACLGEHAEDADHRAVRARGDEDPLLRGHQRPPSKPGGRCVAIPRRPAEALVAQKRPEVGADERDAVAHAGDHIGVVRLRRHVHGEVRPRKPMAGLAAHDRVAPDERAAPHVRFDQASLSGLDIAARHGGEVEGKLAGELALRRQPIARREPPFRDILGDRIGDREVAGALTTFQSGRPRLRHRSSRVHHRPIDCIKLRAPRFDFRRRTAQKRSHLSESVTPDPVN